MYLKLQNFAIKISFKMSILLGIGSIVALCQSAVFKGATTQVKAGVDLNDFVDEIQGAHEIQVCIGNTNFNLVRIPAGKFKMGSAEGDVSERPVHDVIISNDFWMGKFTITQSQYYSIMARNPGNWKNPNNPINQVTWYDANNFISRLNVLQNGLDFSLPTEAEWEFACKAGITGETYGTLNKIAWYGNSMFGAVHVVGQKEPNAFGLYDMLGNVSEWCQDFYGPYLAEGQTDPHGPLFGKLRIVRGGSYISSKKYCRASDQREMHILLSINTVIWVFELLQWNGCNRQLFLQNPIVKTCGEFLHNLHSLTRIVKPGTSLCDQVDGRG
jgi:hypothetical protein